VEERAIDFFFADDSAQPRPSRAGMGPLVAVGGLLVPGEALRDLEQGLGALCKGYGFPPGQEFKWSPGGELWMREQLVAEKRTAFFTEALELAATNQARALVVVEDTQYALAVAESGDHEMDVVTMFLERCNSALTNRRRHGVVVVDRPGGGGPEETRFLTRCLESLEAGTKFVQHDHIAMNVLTTASELVRVLQLADVVVSCSVAYVSGENRYSPAVFDHIRPLLGRSYLGACGGTGFKIHPDLKYVNLYHWLLGDAHYWRRGFGNKLPLRQLPYSTSADTWR
jgi:hypothetical protein